jgi:elongation factor Ts
MTTVTNFTAKDVQELRQRTGAGMMDAKKALTEMAGDMAKAADLLRAKGIAKAEKRAGREASEGIIGHYVHHNGSVAVLVEVNCETDFVARTDDFKLLCKQLAEHIAGSPTVPLSVERDGVPAETVAHERSVFEQQVRESGKPENLVSKIVEGKVEAFYKDVTLMSQPWIREPKKTIGELVKEASAKLGENVTVRRFVRYKLGGE